MKVEGDLVMETLIESRKLQQKTYLKHWDNTRRMKQKDSNLASLTLN